MDGWVQQLYPLIPLKFLLLRKLLPEILQLNDFEFLLLDKHQFFLSNLDSMKYQPVSQKKAVDKYVIIVSFLEFTLYSKLSIFTVCTS